MWPRASRPRQLDVIPAFLPLSRAVSPESRLSATDDEGFARSGSGPNASRYELTIAVQHLSRRRHPRCRGCRSRPFRDLLAISQALVRFYVLDRIEPHAPPLVRTHAKSFGFQPCGRTVQAGHLTRWLGRRRVPEGAPPTTSVHRLLHGLPGYLIRFAPRAFASQRQERAGRPPSPLAFFPRSSHFTAPPGVPPSSPALGGAPSRRHSTSWARGFHRRRTPPPTRSLRPVQPSNARPPRFVAAAGTQLARAYSTGTVLPRPGQKGFTIRRPSSPTRRRRVGLSPIAQDSPLLPPRWPVPAPWGSGPCLSPDPAGHPLRPATRHRLGGP